MTIGEKIKKLRKEAGMTQAELASKLGLKDSVIAKYENGRIPDLKRTTIAGLAKVFNVSPMDTVLLMIYTGVRIGELLSIEKRRCTFTGTIHHYQRHENSQCNAICSHS